MSDQLIRDYYRCFNERRIADAGALFAAGVVLKMPPFVRDATGVDAYAQFADTWLRAFPDAQFTMEHVEQRNETMCEVDLIATGTHTGLLDLGTGGLLQPRGVRLTLRLRELLEIRDGKIMYSSLSVDINQLVRELNQVDYRKLMACLATVWELSDELAKVQGDIERQRDVTERLGRALDAARHAARPQVRAGISRRAAPGENLDGKRPVPALAGRLAGAVLPDSRRADHGRADSCWRHARARRPCRTSSNTER